MNKKHNQIQNFTYLYKEQNVDTNRNQKDISVRVKHKRRIFQVNVESEKMRKATVMSVEVRVSP